MFELRFEKMKYDKNICKVLFTLVILCFTVAGQAQLTVHSVDLNTPMNYSANWTNPLGIGITVNTKSEKYKLFGRVAGFSEGVFQTILFQDTAHGGSYTYDDKLVYKLPDGDSVLTKSFHSYNKGLGIQLGLRSDFKIFSIPFYTSAIEKGANQPEYFAARAALQIGLIYEQKGNPSQAITFFNTCLEMKNHAFKNSLDQKAKTGIQRCLRK